jgi:Tol biopolymer transport system component
VDAYASVWVIRPDGSAPHEVISEKKIDPKKARISWRPDASVIYIQETDFPAMLFGYDAKTGKQVETIRLPKNSFMTEAHSLSPNEQLIAGAGPVGNSPLLHLGTVSRDGSGKEMDFMKLFQAAPYHTGTVVWSYDSQWVAFELDTVVIVMGAAISIHFRAYPISAQEFGAELQSPAFSPSGEKLICILAKSREGNVGSGDEEVATNVWMMNRDGSQQKALTTSGSCFDPHW